MAGPAQLNLWHFHPGVQAAEWAIDGASLSLLIATPAAELLRDALIGSADEYAMREFSNERLAQVVAAQFGALLGQAMPLIALVLLPVLVGMGVSAAVVFAFMSEEERAALGKALPIWFRENSVMLSDPAVVELVRRAVMSADDFVGGVLRLPPGMVDMLGDDGLKILGLQATAVTVIAIGNSAGALDETGISVARSGKTEPTTPAVGWAQRADRIPEGKAQVRIDRYSEPGQPDRFEVYLGGTQDGSFVAGTETSDMTSNLSSIAGRKSGAYKVAAAAMAAAGINPNSPVMFTGYSQGGLVAAQLAASKEFNTHGLFTIGAPAGQVHVPSDISYMAIQHTDDLVPAAGGDWKSATPVLVTRYVFEGRAVPTDVMLPAHQLNEYRHTAMLVDADDGRRVAVARAAFDKFTEGSTRAESTDYIGKRVGLG